MNQPIEKLIATTEVVVRYKEADPMGIVWHGHYVQYFEDGREAFGQKFGLGYKEIGAQNITIPVVTLNCTYKASLRYGDTALIETTYLNSPGAKIEFEYKIFRAADAVLCATGKTTQVFLTNKGELILITPEFINDWKIKNSLSI